MAAAWTVCCGLAALLAAPGVLVFVCGGTVVG